MKSIQIVPKSSPVLHSDAEIISACRSAIEAEINYAFKALVAGQLLIEKRTSLAMTSHSGKSYQKTDRTKPEDAQFGLWLKASGLPNSTAYRWIDCTERIMGFHQIGDSNYIDIEGSPVLISQVLTLPEDRLSADALDLRQSVFAFMADKSLGAAVRAAIGGDSPAHRITRAGNGKLKGGTNIEDRADYPEYIRRALSALSAHLAGHGKNHEARWAKTMTPLQRQQIMDSFSTAIIKWPTPLIEHLAIITRSSSRSHRNL